MDAETTHRSGLFLVSIHHSLSHVTSDVRTYSQHQTENAMQFVAFCFIKIYMQFINIVLSFFLLNIPANTHSTRLDVEWNFFWDWLFTVKCGSDRSVVGFLDIRSKKKKRREQCCCLYLACSGIFQNVLMSFFAKDSQGFLSLSNSASQERP